MKKDSIYDPFTVHQKLENNETLRVRCEIIKFLYKNPQNGYFIFLADLTDDQPNIHIVNQYGEFSGRNFVVAGSSFLVTEVVREQQEVLVTGSFMKDRQNRWQLKTDNIQELIPTKPKAMELFLASGKISGIGPKTAKKIVTQFNSQTLNILDKEPEKLLIINGITEEKLQKIVSSWQRYRAIYDILSVMQLYGIGDSASLKIYNHFKEKSLEIIHKEPYKLTEVPMIGFKTADKIARAAGISPQDPRRIKYGILYVLEDLAEKKGHTAYPYDDLVEATRQELQLDPNDIIEEIEQMRSSGQLISQNINVKIKNKETKTEEEITVNCLSHKKFNYSENKIANELSRLKSQPIKYTQNSIDLFLKINPDLLDQSQLDAANNILNEKVAILTGGPGTGKTHTIKSLIKFYQSQNKNCILCAPTGRAAKRMEESTKHNASTIHRLLGYRDSKFTHDEKEPLSGDVFIIDESSMIDSYLAQSFLRAIPSEATVLFVGDTDQLPPVGAGNFLRDIIESNFVKVCRLNVIHRQAKESRIITAAHQIIKKQMPDLRPVENSDCDFYETQGNEYIKDKIVKIINELILKDIPAQDIQIIVPQRTTDIGTNELNNQLRPILNNKHDYNLAKKYKFIAGDRVMQYRNNYDLEIFNGDIGLVQEVNENGNLIVNFDNREIKISAQDSNDLSLSYAITIHKSQGSDYPYVIIPLSNSHIYMWDVNLLYTAITRGKKKVFLVGEKKAFFYAIAHFKQNIRVTALQTLLKTKLKEENKEKFAINPF